MPIEIKRPQQHQRDDSAISRQRARVDMAFEPTPLFHRGQDFPFLLQDYRFACRSKGPGPRGKAWAESLDGGSRELLGCDQLASATHGEKSTERSRRL